jgi:hypothetical protein
MARQGQTSFPWHKLSRVQTREPLHKEKSLFTFTNWVKLKTAMHKVGACKPNVILQYNQSINGTSRVNAQEKNKFDLLPCNL